MKRLQGLMRTLAVGIALTLGMSSAGLAEVSFKMRDWAGSLTNFQKVLTSLSEEQTAAIKRFHQEYKGAWSESFDDEISAFNAAWGSVFVNPDDFPGPSMEAAYRDALKLFGPSIGRIFSDIYHTNAWQDPESVSGRGSTLARTQIIMSQLPPLLQELNSQSLLDAACGDFNWMRHVDLGAVRYIGIDVVPDLISRNQNLFEGERRTFAVRDITKAFGA